MKYLHTFGGVKKMQAKLLAVAMPLIMVATSLGGSLPFLASKAFALSSVDHIAFLTAPQTVAPNTVSDAITVEAENSSNQPVSLNTSVIMSFFPDSSTGQFAENPNGGSTFWSQPGVPGNFVFASGQTQMTVYYEDSTVGVGQIKASLNVGSLFYNATQTMTVGQTTLAAPTNLRLVSQGNTYACGFSTNIDSITPTWDAVPSAVSYNYKVTLPGGSVYGPINEGDVTSVTGPFGAEGLSTFSVQAVDAYGNTSDWATPCAASYDTSAPVVSVTPVAGSLLHGTETFDITVSDDTPLDPSQNKSVWVYLYDVAGNQKSVGANVDLSSGFGTFTADTTKIDDGAAWLDVGVVRDAAGNVSGTTDNYFKDYTVDNSGPVVSVTPVAGSLLHGTETFNITVIDPNLDASLNKHVWVYLYDVAGNQKSQGASVDLSNGSGTFTVNTTKLDDGTAWLDVGQVVDALGNLSGTTDNYFKNYTIDNTAPAVTVNALFTGDSTPTLTGTIDDPSAIVKVTVHGHTYTATNNGDGTWSMTVPNANKLSDGNYTVSATATDAANNSSSASNSLTIDSHLPGTPTLLTPLNHSFVNTNKPFLSWFPGLSLSHPPIKFEIEVSTDSHFNHIVLDHTTNSLFYSPTSKLWDGSYYVRIKATDSLGGQSGWSDVHRFTIDTVKPNVAITHPHNHAVVTSSTEVTGKISDRNIVGYSWTITNSHNHVVYNHLFSGSHVSPLSLSTLADGSYTISLKAFDKAGNSSITSIKVTVDTTAPVLTITGETQNNDGSYTISGTTDDANAPVVVTLDGTDVTPVTMNGSSWNVTTAVLAAGSTHTVTADSTDAAGNQAAQQSAEFAVPEPQTTTPPVVTTSTTTGSTTPPTPVSTTNATGNNVGQIADADSTTTPSSANTNGQVKGDKTVKIQSAADKTSSKFLGLGWWWILIVLAALGAIWFILARRRNADEEEA